jgi:hypothetical protein
MAGPEGRKARVRLPSTWFFMPFPRARRALLGRGAVGRLYLPSARSDASFATSPSRTAAAARE